MSQISQSRNWTHEALSKIASKYAIALVQWERVVSNATFSAAELREAGVAPASFRGWAQSFARIPPPRDVRVSYTASPENFEMRRTAYAFFMQRSFGLALLLKVGGVGIVQKKLTVVGGDDRCDVTFRELGTDARFLVMFKSNLAFYIENVGIKTILVNGGSLRTGMTAYLPPESALRCETVALVFTPNYLLLSRLMKSVQAATAPPERADGEQRS
jgi:hypothetical protein